MKLGLGGTLLVLGLSLAFGRNFFADLGMDSTTAAVDSPGAGGTVTASPAEEELKSFVSFVLDDVQGVWQKVFSDRGQRYPRAKLVLFRGTVQSGCGVQQSATGPFYCPADHKAYIDLGFYDELKRRFGAPGDFAQAYVLAHEIGHHIQNVTGIEDQVRRAQRANPSQDNALQVRMELQADCYAGVWAHSTERRGLLEQGDVEEALGAASAIGDDRLQKKFTGRVNPETFTHGTSEQRMTWFGRGFKSGRIEDCDTFK